MDAVYQINYTIPAIKKFDVIRRFWKIISCQVDASDTHQESVSAMYEYSRAAGRVANPNRWPRTNIWTSRVSKTECLVFIASTLVGEQRISTSRYASLVSPAFVITHPYF